MSKRCPPGVICIENITIVFVIVILLSVLLFIHYRNKGATNSSTNGNTNINFRENVNIREQALPLQMAMPIPMQMPLEDVLLNPYDAPLRDDRLMPRMGGFIPINVPTQSVDTNYRQVGILTRVKGHHKETILPLMGRPLFTNRDKWNFYTINDGNNAVKLPIIFKGRSCTSEYGCDNLYNGDIVFVEGYNEAFKVTAYDNQVMRYIPFI
jgi:hypothetical protein